MADLTDTQSAQSVKLVAADSSGLEIAPVSSTTDANSNQLLHAHVPDIVTASTALGALNASVTLRIDGRASAGFQIAAGTFIGTLTPESSIDGGTSWVATSFYDPANSTVLTGLIFSSSNTLKVLSVLPVGGASHIRVRVSAYTSGTANGLLRATEVSGVSGALTAAAFGTVSNSQVSIPGNTATLILAANPNRKYAYISNNSGSTLNIQFGSSTGLSTTEGLVISARTFYELKGDNLYTGNIYGYAAGNINISVTEGTP